MVIYKYNLEKRVSASIVLEAAYIRDEVKIRYIVENAGASNVVRIEGRLVGAADWDILLDITGTDNQVVDVSTYEEVQVSVLTYDSLSNYVDIIGSSFSNVSIASGGGTVDSVNGQTGVVVLNAGDIPNTPAGNLSATDAQAALNELQGDIDTINIAAVSYSDSFNATTDWSGPTLGLYTRTISFATHDKTNPIVQVFETNGAEFDQVYTEITVDGSYNVTIKVSSSPNLRFAGKLIIS